MIPNSEIKIAFGGIYGDPFVFRQVLPVSDAFRIVEKP